MGKPSFQRERSLFLQSDISVHTQCGWWEQAWNVGTRGEAVSMGLTTPRKDLRI